MYSFALIFRIIAYCVRMVWVLHADRCSLYQDNTTVPLCCLSYSPLPPLQIMRLTHDNYTALQVLNTKL